MRNLTFEAWAFAMISIFLIREVGYYWLGSDVVLWLTTLAFMLLAIERVVNVRRMRKVQGRRT